MLWFIGLLFVIAWAIGLAAIPGTAWYMHLPLVIGLAAIGWRLFHRREAKP